MTVVRPPLDLLDRLTPFGLRAWWRASIVAAVDHQPVLDRITAEAGLSPRYAFMIMMSAGIAVAGLLLSSPAVVIGAMLISPLMNPILGLGFALATFDFPEVRRSLTALAVGAVLAVAFTAAIVVASPLKEATSEILARTRPNLFDLVVALFAALAGAFAIIKGQGGTIVGVAIATALMPPLAVVGYGLATWNLPVLGGALALFVTNFVTIALSATVMARFYGFGHALSSHQTLLQTVLLGLVFAAIAAPLGLSLNRIAREALTLNEVRAYLGNQYGPGARITQLAIDFDARPIAVRAVVIATRAAGKSNEAVRAGLQTQLKRPVTLQLDQLLVARDANSVDAQRARLQQSEAAAAEAKADRARVADAVAVAAGVAPDDVTVDVEHRRAEAMASPMLGADLAAYRSLEARAAEALGGWTVAVTPPRLPMPTLRFASGSAGLDAAGQAAVETSAWAARRWNVPGLRVPGLAKDPAHPPARLSLAQRRGAAVAAILRTAGVPAIPGPAAGQKFRLAPVDGPPGPTS
ncbi:MAG: DUF389 domain-containing protein [Proteobacteria bacterium]|nr:DUF389 domain-containing protein [Pseudomonadota bacterium]